jgi:hypothetical protein
MPLKSCLAALCLFLCAIAPAQAAPDAEASYGDYKDAADQYSALISRAETEHNPGLAKSGLGDVLIATLSDDKRFLKPAPYPLGETNQLFQICGVALQIQRRMILFGTNLDLSKAGEEKPDRDTLMALGRNVLTFSDQYSQMAPFLMRCYARIARTWDVAGLDNTDDARRKKMAITRNAVLMLYDGTLKMASLDGVDEKLRMSLVQASAETAPDLFLMLTLPMRGQVQSRAEALLKTAPARFAPYLKAVREAAADQHCGPLCQL